MSKDYSLQDLEIFLRVTELGSMSEVARQLDLTNAAVSAAIKRLELALNSTLLERTTRSLGLSQAGERFLPFVQQALAVLDDAESDLRQHQACAQGNIHLGVPSDLGRNLLLPLLDEFQRLHPGINLVVHSSDAMQDLYRENLDLVIRYGELRDSTLIARKLCDNSRILAASPGYLAKAPALNSLEDLLEHNCICFYRNDRPYDQWEFVRDGQPVVIQVKGNRFANDGDLVRRWALADRGVVYKSALDIAADIQQGSLLPVLHNCYLGQYTPLYAVYKERKYQPYRLKVLVNYLQTAFQSANGHTEFANI